MPKALRVSEHVVELSAAVRRRPAMYFGPTGSRAIPKIVRGIIQGALENAPPQFKGPIEVAVGKREITITFRGLTGAFFSPSRFADVLTLPRERLHNHEAPWESLSATQRKQIICRARRDEFLYSIIAGDRIKVVETNGHCISKLIIENGRLQLSSERRSKRAEPMTRLAIELPPDLFGHAGHDEVYVLSGNLRDLSLLQPGLTTKLSARNETEIVFCYERGIESLLFEESHQRWLIYDGILRAAADNGRMKFECAISFVHAGVPRIHNWVNYYPTQGGAHLEAMGRVLQELLGKGGCRHLPLVTNPDDDKTIHLWRSLVGALHLQTDAARFQGPTKDVLIGDDVFDFVYKHAKEQFAAQWADLRNRRAL